MVGRKKEEDSRPKLLDQKAIRRRVEEACELRKYAKRGGEGMRNLQELCDRAGWDKGNFSRLMNPKLDFGSVTVEMMLRLAAALDVRIAWLLTGEPPRVIGESVNEAKRAAAMALRLLSTMAPEVLDEHAVEQAIQDQLRESRERARPVIVRKTAKRRQK